MEFQEPSPPGTDHPAWEAGNRQLQRMGFSHEQIADLFRVKALYQREASHQINVESKRQAFVRWLYLQGRLES